MDCNRRIFSLQSISCLALVLVTSFVSAMADDKSSGGAAKPRGDQAANNPSRVLASVGDELILQADVDLALERTASGRSNLPAMPEPVLMSAVDLIARRRQALETLKSQKKAVSDSAIDKWLTDNSPAELKLTAAQALATRAEAAKVSAANYRNFLAFRLSWQAYLPGMITEKNLESHFTKQKARFDGTRYKLEHLAIVVPPGKSAQRDAAHERLKAIRSEVASGALSMADAGKRLADEHPSAAEHTADTEDYKEPVWTGGSGPLLPVIFDHAMKTARGELSQPFDSATAVHLIRVLDIEPGKRKLEEVQSDVRAHMLLFLLDYLAQQSAKELPLVWLGK